MKNLKAKIATYISRLFAALNRADEKPSTSSNSSSVRLKRAERTVDKKQKQIELVQQTSVKQAEFDVGRRGFKMNPNDAAWIDFKSLMHDGDELWIYSNVDVYLGFCCGDEGYAIVRNGEIINIHVVYFVN